MAKKGKVQGFESVDEIVRPERIKRYQYLMLIVCEDENTEKTYFESFKSRIPAQTIFLRTIGTGRDPKGVVEQAILERDRLARECSKEVDNVWVVFDKDDAEKEAGKVKRFGEALKISKVQEINLAFSNEVFELWLLLHLVNVDPNVPLPRKVIYEQLQILIAGTAGHGDFVYKHGDSEILNKIRELGDEQNALARADALINFHGKKPLLDCNPMTYVNRLILNLYEWIAYYSY